MLNAPGTVDAGYRGEIRVTLLNTDPGPPSCCVAVTASPSSSSSGWSSAVFVEVDELPASVRGAGGFGSTGGLQGAGRHR